MILRRYGSRVESVRPDFDSKAFTEIAFRKDGELSLAAAEFEAEWSMEGEVEELTGVAEGPVQDETQQRLLDDLEADLARREEALGEDAALMVENERTDHPRPRDRQENRIVDGENRLHFHAWLEPPLRISVRRRAGG